MNILALTLLNSYILVSRHYTYVYFPEKCLKKVFFFTLPEHSYQQSWGTNCLLLITNIDCNYVQQIACMDMCVYIYNI